MELATILTIIGIVAGPTVAVLGSRAVERREREKAEREQNQAIEDLKLEVIVRLTRIEDRMDTDADLRIERREAMRKEMYSIARSVFEIEISKATTGTNPRLQQYHEDGK